MLAEPVRPAWIVSEARRLAWIDHILPDDVPDQNVAANSLPDA